MPDLSGKSRRSLLNAGLFTLVVLLSATIWHIKHHKKSAGQTFVPGYQRTSISSIRILGKDGSELNLVRHTNGWHITRPISVRANQPLVDSLLNLPGQPMPHRYSDRGLQLGKYGLSPPQATIEYGNALKISLGNTNPINHLQYALFKKKVYLVDNPVSSLMNTPVTNWISLKLLPPHVTVEHISFGSITTKGREADIQSIHQNGTYPDKSDLKTLIKNWESLSAYRITQVKTNSKNNQTYSLCPIRIKLGDDEVDCFAIVASHPDLVIRNQKLKLDYHLPAAIAKKIVD